jgi:heme/copper-type cytochrome/quinol oxidase subunit 3
MVAYVDMATYFFTNVTLPLRPPEGQGVLFRSISGAHLVMVLVGLALAVLVTIRAIAGQERRIPEGVTALAVYWGITVGVYAVIWYAVYVTK